METSGSDQWNGDMYMLPQLGSHLTSVSVPTMQEVDTVGNEVDYIVDPNLYYAPAVAPANYYGYVYTGFESPGEWDDQYRYFGLDGQDINYQAMQTEGLQYAYYTPSGYAQPPYTPYNPYVPGAVIGSDGPVIGSQPYASSPAYHHSVVPPGYFPVLYQPGLDMVSSMPTDPSLVNSSGSIANRPENQVVQYTYPSSSSMNSTHSGQKESVQMATMSTKLSESALAYKKNMVPGNMPSSSVLQNPQARTLPMPIPTADKYMQGNEMSQHAPVKVQVSSHNSFTEFGSSAYGWVPVDAPQSRMQIPGFFKNGNVTPDMLGEKNRGPRASRSKAQWTPVLVCKAYTTKAGVIDGDGNITINSNQYNRADFPVSYSNAKFFVIKSYSEDDVHKSIKYNVWSSTPNGNRRLDAAYEEARRMSGGHPSNCPVFLFFSVNASGQFCGVAEMMGPVDFHKDMDFWQQDKWTGSFPVKWHIIKDVPNTSFRHIILENNENKPVTNSRDTQEILYIPGLNMLTIFKDSLLRTSILDDFMYYEDRQKIMYEEKMLHSSRSYEQTPIYMHPSFLPARQYITIKEPQKAEVKLTSQSNVQETKNTKLNDQVRVSEMADGTGSAVVDNQIVEAHKADEKTPRSCAEGTKVARVDNNVASEIVKPCASNDKKDGLLGAANGKLELEIGASSTKKVNETTQVGQPAFSNGHRVLNPDSSAKKVDDCSASSDNKVDSKDNSTKRASDLDSIMKISSLSIDKETEVSVAAKGSTMTTACSSTMDVVNVGSMPVKVNGYVSESFTVGTIPIDTSRAMEHSKQSAAG